MATPGSFEFRDRRRRSRVRLLRYVARHRLSEPTAIPGHRLPHWQLLVVVRGSCVLAADGRDHHLPGGSSLVLPAGSRVGAAEARTRGLLYWLGLDPRAAGIETGLRGDLQRALGRRAGRVETDAEAIAPAAEACFEACGGDERQAAARWRLLAAAAQLAAALCAEPIERRHDPAIEPALAAMRAAPWRDHDSAALAALCGLGRARFHQRFRAATGAGPQDWLLERRLDLVESAGREDEATLRRCGFSSRRHYRAVRRRLRGG